MSTVEATPAGEASIQGAVRTALDDWGLHGGELSLVKHRENHVFRLQHRTGDYAVRLHRIAYNGIEGIERELDLLDRLLDAGFSVPRVERSRTGERLVSVSYGGVTQSVSILQWIPDPQQLGDIETAFTGDSSLTPGEFWRVGELAGRLHDFLSGQPSSLAQGRPEWNYDGLIGANAVWGDPFALSSIGSAAPVLREAIDELRECLSEAGQTSENYSIIHADLTPENILISRGALVVIDFDDFGRGWHAFELATLLFWFQRHRLYAQFKESALAGYGSVRPVPNERLLSGMIFARGLTYLGWAAQRPGDETAEFIADQLVDYVQETALRFLANKQNTPERI